MGIDHIPSHTHRPIQGEGGITQDFDRFRGVQPVGDPLAEFQPGLGQESGDGGTTTVTAHGRRGGTTSRPHNFYVIKKMLHGMIPMMVDFLHLFWIRKSIFHLNTLVPKPPNSGTRTIPENDIYEVHIKMIMLLFHLFKHLLGQEHSHLLVNIVANEISIHQMIFLFIIEVKICHRHILMIQ